MRAPPAPSGYDWGSPEDLAVQDVLSDEFVRLWSETAHTNREVFQKIFRPVPNNEVRSWAQYRAYMAPAEGIKVGFGCNGRLDLTPRPATLSTRTCLLPR